MSDNEKKDGVKYDEGKPPIYSGLVAYFPRACSAVSQVSAFGANKYTWGGWRSVPDRESRYRGALARHQFARAAGEVFDPESGFPHDAHIAWNAMAILEIILENNPDGTETDNSTTV